MKIDDDERRFIWWPGELTATPDGATVVLEVNGTTQHAMAWEAAGVPVGTGWTRTARTVKTFTGTSVTPGVNDVALGAGRHIGQPIVTLADGQIITGPHSPIDVT